MSLVEPGPSVADGRAAAGAAARERRRPPTLRACDNHGASALRSSAALALERSISYSAPSSERHRLVRLTAVVIVFQNDLDALRHFTLR